MSCIVNNKFHPEGGQDRFLVFTTHPFSADSNAAKTAFIDSKEDAPEIRGGVLVVRQVIQVSMIPEPF